MYNIYILEIIIKFSDKLKRLDLTDMYLYLEVQQFCCKYLEELDKYDNTVDEFNPV